MKKRVKKWAAGQIEKTYVPSNTYVYVLTMLVNLLISLFGLMTIYYLATENEYEAARGFLLCFTLMGIEKALEHVDKRL